MSSQRPDLLMPGPMMPFVVEQLDQAFTLHRLWEAKDRDGLLGDVGGKIRAIAANHAVDAKLMQRCPKLEIISSFGVGYDGIDVKCAAQQGVIVTNTPNVLDEEVADTAIGLLLMTVRNLPQSERYLRAGKWLEKPFPLSPSLRDRTVGMVGLGRIGLAIARRLDAMNVKVAYHTRTKRSDVAYRHYPSLVAMAKDVDVLMIIVPGGASTKHMVNTEVLNALGAEGIVINVARGSVIDEQALIAALKDKRILTAGLDVFENEPKVPAELIAMEHVVLLPHVGSASVHTRRAMGQLVVDNLLAWKQGKPPLTPVPETPWPPKKAS